MTPADRIRPARARRPPRGQALIEAAVLLPVLVLLVTGVVEMGQAAYMSLVAANAAHAGALYGGQSTATASNDSGMVQAALNDGHEVSGLTATATHVCTCASSGASAPNCALSDCTGDRLLEYAQVSTTIVFTPTCRFPGSPASFTLTGNALVPVKE